MIKILDFNFNNIFFIIFLLVWIFIISGMIYRVIKSYIEKPKCVSAVIFDKYTSSAQQYDFVNRRGTVMKDYYTVCFDVENHIKKFNVSPLFYDYAEKGMKGVLKYKGNSFIDFEEIAHD